MSAINKKSNTTNIYGCKTGNNESGKFLQACESYSTLS